ncbi:hypothetical protein Tco_1518544, partial [Tanacetum coccineum]
MTTAGTRAVVNTGKGKMDINLKNSRWVWRPKGNYLDHVSKDSGLFMLKKGNPEILLQDHAVADSGDKITGKGSSGKDKGPTQEYILLLLQPHRIRILVKDVAPAAHEKPFESSHKDNDVQDSEDAADKEEQHQMKESKQDLQDELEKMVTQELAT